MEDDRENSASPRVEILLETRKATFPSLCLSNNYTQPVVNSLKLVTRQTSVTTCIVAQVAFPFHTTPNS